MNSGIAKRERSDTRSKRAFARIRPHQDRRLRSRSFIGGSINSGIRSAGASSAMRIRGTTASLKSISELPPPTRSGAHRRPRSESLIVYL